MSKKMNKSVKKVLEACLELTKNEKDTFLEITARLQELSITYMIALREYVPLGKVKIKEGKIFSTYDVPAQIGINFNFPPESHFRFLKYLRENTGEVIENDITPPQHLQKHLQNKMKEVNYVKYWKGFTV